MTKSTGKMKYAVKDRDSFIKKSVDIYGEGSFDYSKVDYKLTSIPVTLRCNKHGQWFQVTPNYHTRSKKPGCPKCGKESYHKKIKDRVSKESVISILDEVMLEGYTVPDFNYEKVGDKITIECPVHGTFERRVAAIIKNRSGCDKCKRAKWRASVNKAKEIEVLEIIKNRHPNYDFSEYKYTAANEPSTIVCPKHGKIKKCFSELKVIKTPCIGCYNEGRAIDGYSFREKAKTVHGDKYNYDLATETYINAITDVEIYCNSCEVFFIQQPNNHLQGKGCRLCAAKKLSRTQYWNNTKNLEKHPDQMYKECYLYMFVIEDADNNEVYMKVGISNADTISKRIKSLKRESGYNVIPMDLFKSTRINCLYYEEMFHSKNNGKSAKGLSKFGGRYETYDGNDYIDEQYDILKRRLRMDTTVEEMSGDFVCQLFDLK